VSREPRGAAESEAEADLTFVFADLAGFTALTEVHGDEHAADVATDFRDEVRRLLPLHMCEEVQPIGDALMMLAAEARRAVELGVCIVEEIGARHGFPVIRVGMHTGPVVRRGNDWFGSTINVAARVSAAAVGGEVLLTDATRAAAGTLEGIHLHERGRREFKNVRDPVLLFAAARGRSDSASGLPMDPICRMAVDPAHCAGYLRYAGAEYHFCSLACANAFSAAPDRYAGQGQT